MNLPNLDSTDHSSLHRELEPRKLRPSLRVLGACPNEETRPGADYAEAPPAALFELEPRKLRPSLPALGACPDEETRPGADYAQAPPDALSWDDAEWNHGSHLRKLSKNFSHRETDLSQPSPMPGKTVTRMPLAQIRMILRELDTGDYDLRTVLLNCQGHPPGSPAFRDAYLDARLGVRRSARQQRDLRLSRMKFAAAAAAEPTPSPAFHVIHPGDLLRHFGVWVILVCGLELWIAWRGALILDLYFLGGPVFLALLVAFAFLGLDSLLWLRLRGGHVRRFTLPGFILVTVLAALAAALHLHAEIGNMLSADNLPR